MANKKIGWFEANLVTGIEKRIGNELQDIDENILLLM
jgi:hypothetical protein